MLRSFKSAIKGQMLPTGWNGEDEFEGDAMIWASVSSFRVCRVKNRDS